MDKLWRLKNLYRITNKHGESIPFKPNLAQLFFLQNRNLRNIILKSRQLGFCLDPNTKILTADLFWVPIKDLTPGQEIIGVDEFPSGGKGSSRTMKVSTVEAIVKVKRKAYKITFDDGRNVICTAQHPWLSKKEGSDLCWGTIEFLRAKKGEDRKGHLVVGSKVRWITKPWEEPTVEDGWFGGILDGEGSIAKKNKTASINASQRPGPVWDRMNKYCSDRNYNFNIEDDTSIRKTKFGKTPVPKIVIGRMNEMFHLIGQTRPTRFIKNKFWEGRWLPGRKIGGVGWATITNIEELKEQTMIDLQTSTGTYIAEGFVSHNTTLAIIDMLDNILFIPNFAALLISYDDESARDLFQKKVQFAWEHFHPDLKDKYQVDSSRTNLLRLDLGRNNYSSFKVDSSGRSGTYQQLHVSELGLISKNFPEKVDKIIRGTFPCVHPPHGQITVESTSEGPFGAFHDMFMNAYTKPSDHPFRPTEFKAFFFNWQWDIEALKNTTIPHKKFPREFLDIQKRHNELNKKNPTIYKELTDLHLTYFYNLWEDECNKSFKKLFLEYPLTVEMAFQKDSRAVFDTDKLQKLLAHSQSEQAPQPRDFKGWKFYHDIQPNHEYVLGADPSEGVQRDHCAAVLLDISTLKPQVIATFKDNEIQPDIFAYELKNIGQLANLALIIVERNNSGRTTLDTLKGIYPVDRIYKEERTNKEDDEETEILGWHTNLSTKPKMFYNLSTIINEDQLEDIPEEIIKELLQIDRKFVSEVKTKDDGETSNHQDLATALAIALMGMLQAMDSNDEYVVLSNHQPAEDPNSPL